MSNLVEIQQQIDKLQKQARDIKAREFDKTVQEIRAKMAAFGITVKDLRAAKPSAKPSGTRAKAARKAKGSASAAKAAAVVAPKYRGPNGETWSGRGLMPRWLSALVAQGQSKESFRIQA